mmetsp:Transcript_7333/g.22365  ORF Transcript_7333/g.22365 Transcript_7333/m.22365 type:complete len:400 (-) Transcript_7333:123-1322(-)
MDYWRDADRELHSPFVRGRHLHDLPEGPTCCEAGAVVLDVPPFDPVAGAFLPQVPGARLFRNVCSAVECAQILLLAEGVGLEEEAGGGGTQRATLFVDADLNRSLFERVWPLLPHECLGGHIVGLDRLWVVERSSGGSQGRPRLQEARDESSCANGCLSWNAERTSRATVMLFLDQGVEGGEFRFWAPGRRTGVSISRPAAVPEQGTAIFFFHGDHPLSAIHEDAPVHCGTRHVLRCSVLYERWTDGEREEFERCVHDHPDMYEVRRKFEELGLGAGARGSPGCGFSGAPLEQLLALLWPGALPAFDTEPLELGQPIEAVLPAGNQTQGFTLGELVEAFWAPEGSFFRARITDKGDGSTLSVGWVDWEGTAMLPVSKVRRLTVGSAKPLEADPEWVVID